MGQRKLIARVSAHLGHLSLGHQRVGKTLILGISHHDDKVQRKLIKRVSAHMNSISGKTLMPKP